MAAEMLSAQGFAVSVYERKPSVARKFLMAGRGGLNLTHSEDLSKFIGRYGDKAQTLAPLIESFPPQALRDWCEGLGQKTFVGTSGRVFPESFKASPLLRAWVKRLEGQGVRFKLSHDWQGWDNDGALVFNTPGGTVQVTPDATLLALGGASWPRLGSDGSWTALLEGEGVKVAPLQAANCGFTVEWSELFCGRFAGQPLKAVTACFEGASVPGEIMMTERGLEGGAIYALSSRLREAINRDGSAELMLDLKPDLDEAALVERLGKPRGGLSFSNYLRKTLNLSPVAVNLLMESPERKELGSYPPEKLARLIKNYPVTLQEPFPIDRAISSAGGVSFDAVDDNYMLKAKPGVFVAGEMLDWEAPTGGYLLQASFATGVKAAKGIADWLAA